MEADFLDKYEIQFLLQILHPPPPRNPKKKIPVCHSTMLFSILYCRGGEYEGRSREWGARKLPRVFISSFFQFLPISPVCEVQHTLLKKYLAVPTTSSKYLNVA